MRRPKPENPLTCFGFFRVRSHCKFVRVCPAFVDDRLQEHVHPSNRIAGCYVHVGNPLIEYPDRPQSERQL